MFEYLSLKLQLNLPVWVRDMSRPQKVLTVLLVRASVEQRGRITSHNLLWTLLFLLLWVAFLAVSTHCWASHQPTPPSVSAQACSQCILNPACIRAWDCPDPGHRGVFMFAKACWQPCRTYQQRDLREHKHPLYWNQKIASGRCLEKWHKEGKAAQHKLWEGVLNLEGVIPVSKLVYSFNPDH